MVRGVDLTGDGLVSKSFAERGWEFGVHDAGYWYRQICVLPPPAYRNSEGQGLWGHEQESHLKYCPDFEKARL